MVNSKWLPNVFALVMQIGNYLNHGTNKGSQRGFTLDTLPLLTRVEGFEDKTYSLIRFIMDTLEADRKVKDGALEDLKLCEDASKLDFDESVRRLNELEKRVTTVEALLEQGEPGENDRFHEAMQGFVKDARERLSKLREQVEQVRGGRLHFAVLCPCGWKCGCVQCQQGRRRQHRITISALVRSKCSRKKLTADLSQPCECFPLKAPLLCSAFGQSAQPAVMSVAHWEVQTLSKQCCDLFAEKPKTPSPETLGKLAAFRKEQCLECLDTCRT